MLYLLSVLLIISSLVCQITAPVFLPTETRAARRAWVLLIVGATCQIIGWICLRYA